MEIKEILGSTDGTDRTWEEARAFATSTLNLNPPVLRLIRGGWEGGFSPEEFLKIAGASRINLACLLQAAKVRGDGRKPGYEQALKALSTLGMNFGTLVVAVNLVTRLFLKSKPASYWKHLLQEMMSSIEVGYQIGTKIPEFGPASGALMGFAEYLGQMMAGIKNGAHLKQWKDLSVKHGKVGRKIEIDLFGCEMYQIGAFGIQHLGFGVNCAVGTALGMGKMSPEHLNLGREILCWQAALSWVSALRRGRDMPPDLEVREFFKEIAPPRDRSEKNLVLGVLYTEIAKVRGGGSDWTWHLPLPSYESTQNEWNLPVN